MIPKIQFKAAATMLVWAVSFFSALTFWAPGYLAAQTSATPPAPPAPSLVIFHTNDVHGYALEEKDAAGVLAHIGYARAKGYIDAYPAANKLLLDAGDVLHGRPFATAQRGEFIARILKLMNYDALAVGNHDFDYGLPRLMELRDRYGLNFLAANIIEREDGVPLLPPYIVKDFGDLKVGVFALSTPETPVKTTPGNVESVTFGDAESIVATAQALTRKLREEDGVDLVVALTHLGTDPQDVPGAQAVARDVPGLDLVVDGHSHTRLAGLRVGDALIVSTGALFENLGRVEVIRTGEGRLILAPKLLPAADLAEVQPDALVLELVTGLESELSRELDLVASYTPIDLNGERTDIRYRSTNLGRLICASILKATRADAAMFNSGSIRASIPAGDITKGRLLEVLPYDNYVVTIQLTGRELLEALNIGLSQPGEGVFPQFYGLEVTAVETVKYGADGSITRSDRAQTVTVGGRLLEPDQIYTLAINDFMRDGGDGYLVLKKPELHVFNTVEEIFRDYLMESDRGVIEEIDREDPLTIIVVEEGGPAAQPAGGQPNS